MSDPFEELKRMGSTGLPSTPLPAVEVRRRGDRLRRRRTALSAAGAAVAVAVVASGGLFVGQNLTGGAPPVPGPATQAPSPAGSSEPPGETPVPGTPVPAPEDGWVTQIPEGLSIADELPEPGGDNGDREETDSLETPWMLDPCRNEGAPDDQGATDFLGLGQPVPAGFFGRQLAVYSDADAAAAAMVDFRDEIGECQVYLADDGISEARTLPVGGAVPGVDESLVVVDKAYTSGMPTTLATHFLAVRVGNAVFLMVQDGEFGAAQNDSGTARVDREQRAIAAGIIDRLCIFAADPCGSQTPDGGTEEPRTEPVLNDDNLITADQLPPVEDELVGPWQAVEPQPVPTLSCQAQWLDALEPAEMVYREFRAPYTDGGDYSAAEVNTAVLAFDGEDAAARAYETVAAWVESCENRVDDDRPVAYNDEPAVHPQVKGGEAIWRNVHLFAPEVCQECDAIWFDRQGAALVGDRLVLVSFARLGGPLEPEGLDAAMRQIFDVVVEAGRS